ncbi:hypothetical protein ACQY0O_004376 [Thecaphora frezii]
MAFDTHDRPPLNGQGSAAERINSRPGGEGPPSSDGHFVVLDKDPSPLDAKP